MPVAAAADLAVLGIRVRGVRRKLTGPERFKRETSLFCRF